jgi:transcription elongation factor Elf1
MRREDYAAPQTSMDSPWRQFVVTCLKCNTAKVRAGVVFEDGEPRVYLYCPRCNLREAIAV